MLCPRSITWICSAGLMTLPSGLAYSQDTYPQKPIRIVTASVGGGADFVARLIAQGISGPMGQQVVVDNRGGGVGFVSGEIVASAAPDGYTLLVSTGSLWLAPFLMDKVSFDPLRDFLPITLASIEPNILVVHPSLPVRSVSHLISLAKAKPGELNYGEGGAGSSPHLAGELFKAMAGVNIVGVRYKGGAPALIALIAGDLQLMFSVAGPGIPHVRSGRLRALAVTVSQPSVLFPELPTMAASGLPGYRAQSIYGVFAPAKTPSAVITRLNQEIVKVLVRADVKERVLNTGSEVVGSSPSELAAAMKSDMGTMGKLIKDAGIRAQ